MYYNTKVSADNERKALKAQLSTEKLLASDQLAAYEEEIQLLCKEKDEFEAEKRSLFIEKASPFLSWLHILYSTSHTKLIFNYRKNWRVNARSCNGKRHCSSNERRLLKRI